NFFRAQFLRQRTGEHVYGAFGGAVHAGCRGWRLRSNGADVDNGTAIAVDISNRSFRRKEKSEHVKIEVLPEVLLVDFLQGTKLVQPGVINEDVDCAERLFRLRKKPLDLVWVCHIRWHGHGLGAC